MSIQQFNDRGRDEAARLLATCCGSARWLNRVMEAFPFVSAAVLLNEAEIAWYDQCDADDWKEAFTHHPKIGDVESLQKKFAATSHLAGNEQSGVDGAPADVLKRLAEANRAYEEKFGFIFIVCATGKSAAEMLRLLEDRMGNSPEEEMLVAMGEQHKITILRIRKLLPDTDWGFVKRSQVTTHVLDTSAGRPGAGVTIRLLQESEGRWLCLAQGVTDADGRIGDLLPPMRILLPGCYQMHFDTGRYFLDNQVQGFYPEVGIHFLIRDGSHYHVPLLINPFGYATYRGS